MLINILLVHQLKSVYRKRLDSSSHGPNRQNGKSVASEDNEEDVLKKINIDSWDSHLRVAISIPDGDEQNVVPGPRAR